jgi:hypothetical protein
MLNRAIFYVMLSRGRCMSYLIGQYVMCNISGVLLLDCCLYNLFILVPWWHPLWIYVVRQIHLLENATLEMLVFAILMPH